MEIGGGRVLRVVLSDRYPDLGKPFGTLSHCVTRGEQCPGSALWVLRDLDRSVSHQPSNSESSQTSAPPHGKDNLGDS